jgi:hypothetical protein
MTKIEKKQEDLLLMHFKIEELEQRLEMTEAGWGKDKYPEVGQKGCNTVNGR